MKCFVNFRLRPGVTVDEYVEWFRTENLDAAAAVTAIRDYRVWHRRRIHEGKPSWDFVEEMEVLDLELCEREFEELQKMQDMLVQWRAMVTDQSVVFARELPVGKREHVGAAAHDPDRPSRVKRFVTFQLAPGVSVDDYLTWFHAESLPAVAGQTTTQGSRLWQRYKVHEGEPSWDFLEEVDIRNAEHTERELHEPLPGMRAMTGGWHDMVSDPAVVLAEEVR